MKYSSSIKSLLSYFKDRSFWMLTQYSNDLKHFRQDLSGQWQDSASNEIHQQYLGPHEEDRLEMSNWFEKQQQSIELLTLKLDEVEGINNNILGLSDEIRLMVADCEEDLRKAITNFDFAADKKNEADSKIPLAAALLKAANSGEFSVD